MIVKTIYACPDCSYYALLGEMPSGAQVEEEEAREGLARLKQRYHHDHIADSDTVEFSTLQCDICGSNLHGCREELTLVRVK